MNRNGMIDDFYLKIQAATLQTAKIKNKT